MSQRTTAVSAAAIRSRRDAISLMGPFAGTLLAFLLGAMSQFYSQSATGATTGPTIRLFPTTVLEDIRQTGLVAEEMESGLQTVIRRMDQQEQLFTDSKCEGAEDDPGCAQIAKNLGATYLEMLTIMGDRLPDMERAVSNTRVSLEKRLRAELGNRMSASQLQETLLGNNVDGQPAAEPRLRGRSGLRLSERFRQYYQLVSNSGSTDNQSLAVIASDIYLDMEEAGTLIAQTQEEIGRATLMEQLNQSFGMITPEMQQVVNGVKAILFGDLDPSTVVAGPPPGTDDQVYRSPLEL